MTLVSISEASRLTGKTRATIHRHINTGKLSKSSNNSGGYGIEISELIRVYGELKDTQGVPKDTVKIDQHNTADNIKDLQAKLAVLEAENNALKDHVSSLKQALHLIENYKQDKPRNEAEQKGRKKFLGLF